MIHVLIVEDEVELAELIIEFLETEGVQCDFASNGQQALNLVSKETFDVLVVDIMMPKMNGLQFCRSIREQGITTPCLLITALDQITDKQAGFDAGSDDYLVKPFALQELLMRIQALSLRRSMKTSCWKCSDLTVNFTERKVKRGNRAIDLTANEWRVFEYIVRRSPEIANKKRLQEHFSFNENINSSAFKMCIHRLRNKLHHKNEAPLLHTIRGQGYVLADRQ